MTEFKRGDRVMLKNAAGCIFFGTMALESSNGVALVVRLEDGFRIVSGGVFPDVLCLTKKEDGCYYVLGTDDIVELEAVITGGSSDCKQNDS